MNKLINKFFALLRGSSQIAEPEEVKVPVPQPIRASVTDHAIPVYPPNDQGILLQSIDSVMQTQSDLLLRFRRLAGGKAEHFDLYYLQIIRNLAEYIHLLPASQSSTHSGAGGLFRLCLEVAFYSLQSSDGYVFSTNEGIEERKEIEPRWRYATFIAALTCELYRVVSDMVVTDQHGSAWPKYQKALTTWCKEANSDRYFVFWHASKNLNMMVTGRTDVALLINAIIPTYVFQYLEDANSKLLPIVFAVASGSSHPSENKIAEIVSVNRQKADVIAMVC